MPRLKGNSSHGSKPTTRLSRTFSWMPHCIPQNEQCVLTSASGRLRAASAQPPGGASLRCGPKASASRSMGSGGTATSLVLQSQLGRAQGGSLARGPQPLPGDGGAIDPVVEAKRRQHAAEILDLHTRGVALPAPRAYSALVFAAGRLIELHAELGRPLKDVEELAE